MNETVNENRQENTESATNLKEVGDLELRSEEAGVVQGGTELPKTPVYSIVIDRRPAL